MNGNGDPTQLINFLHQELAVSEAAIAVALNHWQQDLDPLPMIFWQYGFISLEQLGRIFDWLGDQAAIASSTLFDRV